MKTSKHNLCATHSRSSWTRFASITKLRKTVALFSIIYLYQPWYFRIFHQIMPNLHALISKNLKGRCVLKPNKGAVFISKFLIQSLPTGIRIAHVHGSCLVENVSLCFIVNWLLMGVECFAAKRTSIWGCEGKNVDFLVFFWFLVWHEIHIGAVEGGLLSRYFLYF